LPELERCQAFVEGPRVTPDRPYTRTGRNHPTTSHQAGERAVPKSGTKRRQILDLIRMEGHKGRTDDEIEDIMGWPHQTVSARRGELVIEGWIVSAGITRLTRSGFQATVWKYLPD
jgi:hypothetical protein